MKIQELTIGQKVRHAQHGIGTIKTLSEKSAEIRFDDAQRTIDPELSELSPAEPAAALSGLNLPLKQLIQAAAESTIELLGFEKPDTVVEELGTRWQKGKAVLHPADPTLQPKEIPLEVFFHKIVGLRNQLRVLEQKLNGHPTLSDAEKVEMQQYISRCYGSLTTFNVLFKNKEGQFSSKSE